MAIAVRCDGGSESTGALMSTSARPSASSAARVRRASSRQRMRPPKPGQVAGREGEVLDGVQRADEAEVLVHEADAGVGGGLAVAERRAVVRGPTPVASSGVGLVVAGEDLDQRRLAGAVLADEGVDLAGGDVERNVVEGDLPGKGLREVFDAQRLGHVSPHRR